MKCVVLYRPSRLLLSHKTPSLSVSCVQVHQERMYQEYSLSRAESQLKQMEKVLNQQNQSRELELSAMRGEIACLKKVNHSTFITSCLQ